MNKYAIITLFSVGTILLGATSIASADHAWGNYHWARSINPFTVALGDNVSANWDAYLATSASDWNTSSVLDIVVLPGLSSVKTCKPVAGRVEVCNSKYGRNGWLGIASIWASGDHITQGTVKMNDTYFNTATYNTSAWRNLVMCQEVGHVFGLDHQDETFNNANLGTCMDYTNAPADNQHPNLHDYEMLETIYTHSDTTASTPASSLKNGSNVDLSDPSEWGQEVRRSKNGRASVYERDFGNGNKAITHVFWAEPKH